MEALPYILIVNGALIALFVAWVFASHLWQRLMWRLFPKRLVIPPYGASVKIVTLGAVYESRFMGQTNEGWAIETLAEAIPAVRLGEPALVEIACKDGVIRFRSELVELLTRQHATVMRPPTETQKGNRRTQKRIRFEHRAVALLEGSNSIVKDVSEGGARLSTNHVARRGERVKFQIPGSDEPMVGHVLEVLPNLTKGYANDVRVVFDEPVKVKDLSKKLAPAR